MSFTTTNQELFNFIDSSPSPYHGVESICAMLKEDSFIRLNEWESWKLKAGDKYYVVRNDSSVIAFKLPRKDFTSFQIVASHSDSPCFKLKENSIIKVEDRYVKLNTECYGGMIYSSWMDRPLSIAGRVLVRIPGGIYTRLLNIDRDLLIIPNLAIHMNRDINKGYNYNPQIDLLPLLGEELGSMKAFLAKELGQEEENILSADLFLYPRAKGTVLGINGEFIASPRLDDLQCAFSSVKALLESENPTSVTVAAVFDNEEVGSGTKQGAASTFLFDTLTRISSSVGKSEEEYRMAVSESFMVSADNAHALHPNFPDKSDKTNRNYLNRGPVIKFSASQKYTTDAVSASMFMLICERNQVPCQVFHNRSDMPGGSTLGNISNERVSLNTVDIGIPQLAMHSAVETAGAKDTEYMMMAMRAFYKSRIRADKQGLSLD